MIEGRNIALPFSRAIPMVASNFFAFSFASALCARMPFGKKSRLPKRDSIENTSAFSRAITSFNSAASGGTALSCNPSGTSGIMSPMFSARGSGVPAKVGSWPAEVECGGSMGIPAADNVPRYIRPRRRWWVACVVAALVLIIAIYVAHAGAWLTYAVTVRRLQAERTRIQRAGEPLKVSEAVPKLAPGEPNAAPLYQQAFNNAPQNPADARKGLGRRRSRTPPAAPYRESALLRAAGKGLADSQVRLPEELGRRCRRQISRARALPRSRPSPGGEGGSTITRRTRRRRGRLLPYLLRLADHAAQAPSLVAYLVSVAVQSICTRELARVLSAGDPSPTACRRALR